MRDDEKAPAGDAALDDGPAAGTDAPEHHDAPAPESQAAAAPEAPTAPAPKAGKARTPARRDLAKAEPDEQVEIEVLHPNGIDDGRGNCVGQGRRVKVSVLVAMAHLTTGRAKLPDEE